MSIVHNAAQRLDGKHSQAVVLRLVAELRTAYDLDVPKPNNECKKRKEQYDSQQVEANYLASCQPTLLLSHHLLLETSAPLGDDFAAWRPLRRLATSASPGT